jgi:DNA-directed RNA polymerase subunit RPC12/RpoP
MCEDMASFLIIVCGRCGKLLLAKAEQKARTCPYCGFKVAIEKAKRVASAENAHQASTILRKLKRDAISKRKTLAAHDSFKASH